MTAWERVHGWNGFAVGDVFGLHAYAWPKLRGGEARWSVYNNADQVAVGYVGSLGEARQAAEAAMVAWQERAS